MLAVDRNPRIRADETRVKFALERNGSHPTDSGRDPPARKILDVKHGRHASRREAEHGSIEEQLGFETADDGLGLARVFA